MFGLVIFKIRSFKVSIRQCRRAVVDLDKIVLVKHKLTIHDFKPKTDFNIELVVGVQEFRNITCQTPYVTSSFDKFVGKAICRFTYCEATYCEAKFWPIVAKCEGDKVCGNGDRIVDKEAIKDVCLIFRFLSVSGLKNNMFLHSCDPKTLEF